MSAWRILPLGSGLLMGALLVLTLNAAIVLAPLPILLTLWASRRLGDERGAVFWIGAVLNVWWLLGFAIAVGQAVHHVLIA